MDKIVIEKPQDIQDCEEFLRAVKKLGDIDTSIRMWEQCRQHEWHEWEWDAELGEIVRREERRILKA